MVTIKIPGKLTNKANTYVIHVHPSLWKLIRILVEKWKVTTHLGPWWIAPSEEAKNYEAEIAWRVLAAEKREWLNDEPLTLTIRLVKQRHDVDAVKAILDGIQKSGRIKNDKQFRRIVIEHVDGKTAAVELEIEPIAF